MLKWLTRRKFFGAAVAASIPVAAQARGSIDMANTAAAPSGDGGLSEAFARLATVEAQLAGSISASSGSESADRLIRLDAAGRLDPSVNDPKREAVFARSYDVLKFGAIWDGDSHPLSQRFRTLADARAVYPHAVALTDEIDWAATQAAINAVVLEWANGHGEANDRLGAVVALPGGVGRLNRELTLPYRPYYAIPSRASVSLRGQGRGSTVLMFKDNAAPIAGESRDRRFALRFREASVANGRAVWSEKRVDDDEMADVELSGFMLKGPGCFTGFPAPKSEDEFVAKYGFRPADWTVAYNPRNPAIGQLFETYSGIELPDRTVMRDVMITGFHKGIVWHGGQRLMENCLVENCYYALYFERNLAHHGDQILLRSSFSGRFACVGMTPGAGVFLSANTCFFGGSPFVFYKEQTPAFTAAAAARTAHGTHWDFLLAGSKLEYCQFEKVGNTILAEGNPVRQHIVQDVTIEHCTFVDSADHVFPPSGVGANGIVPRDALIADTRVITRVSLRKCHDPMRWVPRAEATLKCVTAGVIEVDSADELLAAAAAAKLPFALFSGVVAGTPGSQIRLVGGSWIAGYFQAGSVAGTYPAIKRGDLVGFAFSRIEQHSAARPGVVGIALDDNRDPTRDSWLPVATDFSGVQTINAEAGTRLTQAGMSWSYSALEPGKLSVVVADRPVFGRVVANTLTPALQARVVFTR